MTIAPIHKDVFVPIPPARAFALFTERMEAWWPRYTCPDQREKVRAVTLEPHQGGRWLRLYENGTTGQIGAVRAWEPPSRLVLGWQLDAGMRFDPALLSEVELRFEPEANGTRVRLEHRDLHRLGAEAAATAERIQGGWSTVLPAYAALGAAATVWGIPGSPYVQSVLLALEETATPWRLEAITLAERREPAHRARHPFARVPAFAHGDFQLYETQAILRYLARIAPGARLVAEDPRAEARMNQLCGITDWYVMPDISGGVSFGRVIAPKLGLPVDEDRIRAAAPRAAACLDEIARLQDGQDFLAGPALTLADLMLAPHLSYYAATPEGREAFAAHPALAAWLARMEARPSFAATGWEALERRAAA